MKICVEKFGAIKKGTVDLSKNITVFCGPNGTGKTYMAYLVYGLLGSRRAILNIESCPFSIEDLIAHKVVTLHIDKKILYKYRTSIINSARRNLDTIFGISDEKVTSIFSETLFSYGETKHDFYTRIIDTNIYTEIELLGVRISIEKKECSDVIALQIMNDIDIHNVALRRFEYFLLSAVYYQLSIFPINRTSIFPVERNSVFTFSKELSIRKQEKWDQVQRIFEKKEREKMDRIEMMMASSRRYPLPIRDNLMVADDISEIKKRKSEFFEFAETLEKKLLHGMISISGDDDLLFLPKSKEKTSALPIQITASVVKSMSGLIVYLKHIAQKNDLIIIDEPEINMHPDSQLVLTRVFAQLANAGFRLLISTHSDYVIRELNNLIMGAKNPQVASKLGYQKGELITKDDISVYYFEIDRETQLSMIKNIEVKDSGFDAPSIDTTIRHQSEIAETLYYKLF